MDVLMGMCIFYRFSVLNWFFRFSCRILWLHVGPSNNDPYIIAGYYLECVKTLQGMIETVMVSCCLVCLGCPTIVRSDKGTENCNVAFLQPFLRESYDDTFKGEEFYVW